MENEEFNNICDEICELEAQLRKLKVKNKILALENETLRAIKNELKYKLKQTRSDMLLYKGIADVYFK